MPPKGATLLELIIVLAIIAGLLALLFPAVQHARESARQAVCCNNLNQLRIATDHYWEASKKIPDVPLPNRASGWAIAILPFLEEQTLGEQLANNPIVSAVSGIAKRRPSVMTCPDAWEGDSNIAPILASHYTLSPGYRRQFFSISDVPISFRSPWIESPERIATPINQGPHSGGYFETHSGGDVRFFEGR
jgi:type II secretory pathway pseudopilin PulG